MTGFVMNIRIGEGWDVHALVAGRRLVIGGVEIPHTTGLLGHSDADVLLHAITDALLGAAGLGDIGRHFPDTSADFKDADSWVLLQLTGQQIEAKGYTIINNEMRERIAAALGITVSQVNVKAKTAEKLGPVGELKSMEARAVVLLNVDS
jgi:2-C-methyl-D-erythritol 2,4-cyclodiphosphate synthase